MTRTPETLKEYFDRAIEGVEHDINRRFAELTLALEQARVAMRDDHSARSAAWHDRFLKYEEVAQKRIEALEKAGGATSKLVWVGVGLAMAAAVFLPLMLAR